MSSAHNLKDANQGKNTAHAAAGAGVVDSYPESIALTISERCNFRCLTCCQQHRPEADLSPAAVERLGAVLPHVRTVSITGGEPLLHPGLDNLLGLAQKAGTSTIVLTNGSLLNAEKSAYLVDKQVTFLKISCDGASAKTYNAIRKGGDFIRLVGDIAGLTARKLAAGSIVPVLEFNFVAMRSTILELPRLTVLAGELGVEVLNVLPLRADSPALARESLYFYQKTADETMRLAKEMGDKIGVHVVLPPLFAAAEPGPGDPGAVCEAPWRGVTVNVDGSAGICCGGAGSAGNLNETDFLTAWNHPKRARVRETVNTDGELPCCRDCRLGKQNPSRIGSHIPDPEIARAALTFFGGKLDNRPRSGGGLAA
ncbi:MAG: radical SAM protein [Desulfovibrionaceae bacterium]|nr:radical SAM protein [Desulfovibrionaceae bacterium]MBF0513788.1 radical SAM protein [Desulfovibrionaceae bacterium]